MAENRGPTSQTSFPLAQVLFELARGVYVRMGNAPDREASQPESLIVTVLAAASVEAFINEAAELVSQIIGPHPASVNNFARLSKEVQNLRGSIYLKFNVARLVFAGETYPTGVQPYQDFKTLIDLRNDILHLRLDTLKVSAVGERRGHPPDNLRGLPKRILAEIPPNSDASWTTFIMTRAAARWACNAAAGIVQSLLEILPESHYRETMEIVYKRSFVEIT